MPLPRAQRAAQLVCEQPEEEGREDRVESQVGGVAERASGERADRGAGHPGRVVHDRRAQHVVDVESPATTVRQRPRGVDDRLADERPPQRPASHRRRERDPHRQEARVQERAGDDRGRRTASVRQHGRRRELR